MDDGFQNPSLQKDLSFVVVDGVRGFGNGRVIPAGPLRETVAAGIKRANAVVVVGEDGGVGQKIRSLIPDDRVLSAQLAPHTEQPMDRKRRYLAFAGIGHPEKFFDTLRNYGLPLSDQIPFPDHHIFTEDELSMLREKAVSSHAALITTEKDWANLYRCCSDRLGVIHGSAGEKTNKERNQRSVTQARIPETFGSMRE